MNSLEATLEWVNRRRAEIDLEPIEDLPKGFKGAQSCPVANALTSDWDDVHTHWSIGHKFATRLGDMTYFDLPLAVSTFVKQFDRGQFPQYEAD